MGIACAQGRGVLRAAGTQGRGRGGGARVCGGTGQSA